MAAGELGVNPNTVQKAYSYLEERGLIASLLKKGAYVTYKDETSKEAAEEKLRARKFLIELKEKGVTESEITDIIKEVYCND